MADLPSGTVTFLFTDIEGSTTRWEHQRAAMQAALARHDAILRTAIEVHGGHVFKTVGDAFCAVFTAAPDALEAALAAQRALASEAWDEVGPLRVRVALHTGTVQQRDDDYFGPPLNRVARLLAAGHGGQVLLSAATHELVRDHLPAGTALRDMGEHRLKDLIRPEHVFQLVAPDLPSDFPPLRTLENRPNNLPLQLTPFIGREHDLAALRLRLLDAGTRLVTLTGPGGTGKTRIALQVAADLLVSFPDGVWFVNLAPIADPSLLASTIATALGVPETGGQALLDSLKAYLREKHLLLVLDNFEQITAVANQVADLLAVAPALKVLVTSRVPLHVRGEREYAVPPLPLPDRAAHTSPDWLSQYEAVRLFIERARDVQAEFAVTNANAPAVAEICHRLDGLPLAIELAAARVKLLSPEAILQRLDRPLKLLSGGARDLHTRQQTLRATIDWSYNLLAPEEQTLFRRLGVFAGGFDLAAVEAVCSNGDEAGDVFDGVAALVDNSVVRPVETLDGEPRFTLLETIREYALERLEAAGETGGLRRRHVEYFLTMAERGDLELRGPNELAWLNRLETEHDNLRAALQWTLNRGEPGLGLRLAGALILFWYYRGHWSEGRAWLERLLAVGDAAAPAVRARALAAAGYIPSEDGPRIRAWLEESLRLWQAVGDKPGIAESLYYLGTFRLMEEHDKTEARAYVEESARLFWEIGDRWSLARTVTELGNVAYYAGDYDAVGPYYHEGLHLAREVGAPTLLAYALHQVGSWSNWYKHDPVQSVALLKESLALNRELNNKRGMSYDLGMLGEVARLHGDYERAAAYYEEGLMLSREIGDSVGASLARLNLGLVARARGDYTQAAALLRESLLVFHEVKWTMGCCFGLESLAAVAVDRGQAHRAARLFGASEALRETIGIAVDPRDRPEHDRDVAAARAQLDDATWQEALAEGRAMTLDQDVAFALEEIQDA